MRFKCTACNAGCEAVLCDNIAPKRCLYSGEEELWEEVPIVRSGYSTQIQVSSAQAKNIDTIIQDLLHTGRSITCVGDHNGEGMHIDSDTSACDNVCGTVFSRACASSCPCHSGYTREEIVKRFKEVLDYNSFI